MGNTEPGARRPRRRGGCLSSLLVPLFVLLSLVLSRNAIATSIAEKLLEERHVACADLEVSIALTLDEVTLGPTTCEFSEGRLASLALPEGATVALADWAPSRLTAPVIEATLEASMHDTARQLSLVGGVVTQAGGQASSLPERVEGYVDGLADLARHGGPRVDVQRLIVKGAPGVEVEVDELLIEGEPDALTIRAAALRLPSRQIGLPGVAEVSIRTRITGPTVAASRAAVTITGTVEVEGSVAGHQVERGAPFRVEALGLDTDSPSYQLYLERS